MSCWPVGTAARTSSAAAPSSTTACDTPPGSTTDKGLSRTEVVVEDEAASRYYRHRFGLLPLPDDPHKLFMPLATLRQALGER